MLELPFFLKHIKDSIRFRTEYTFSKKKFNEHTERIKSFKNKYKGGRCFIVGTGPSLNQTNLELIKDEIVIGVNSLYRNKTIAHDCDFFACSDLAVWKKHQQGIQNLCIPTFIASAVAINYLCSNWFLDPHSVDTTYLLRDKNIIPLKTKGYMSVTKEFSTDPSKYVVGGHTIIADICLQICHYMGFSEVYLLGCDYSNKGVRWDGLKTENLKGIGLQDHQRIFDVFEICKRAYEKDNKKIINCTVGGALEVFKRKKLEDVVIWK